MSEKQECPICYLNSPLISPKPCSHKICYSCFKKIAVCPLCKSVYTKGSLAQKKKIYIKIDKPIQNISESDSD